MVLPLLLKPRWLAFRHSLKDRFRSPQLMLRDLLLLSFLVLLSYLTYFGTESLLMAMQSKQTEFYVSHHVPLQVLLLLVFCLLLFSSGIIALNTLLISQDLERLLAAPLSRLRFFTGKFSEIFLFSSWSVLVFIIPIVLAFSLFHAASPSFSVYALLLGFIFVAIPVNLSIVTVVLLTRVVPATRVKELLLLGGLLAMAGMYVWFRSAGDLGGDSSIEDVLRIYSITQLDQNPWLPSSWLAASLGILLGFLKEPLAPYLILLCSAFGLSLALAYLSVSFFYQEARMKALVSGHRVRTKQIVPPFLVDGVRWFIPSAWWGVWLKEVRLFARDLTQAAQLVLLLTLVLIYLFNFRSLPLVQTPPESHWWLSFLSLGNFVMSSFVLIAVAARFAFPTTALEGKAWWILQTSSLTVYQILRAKFYFWYFTIALLASVIFLAGGLALQLREHLLVGQVALALVSTYGIVGMAVGFGARFAAFDWEHPSQITSSLGSFLYMAVAIAAVVFQLIPVTILCLVDVYFENPAYSVNLYQLLVFGADCLLLILLNLFLTRRALQMGAYHLEEKGQPSFTDQARPREGERA